jgi:hypothetical protein
VKFCASTVFIPVLPVRLLNSPMRFL